MISFLFSCVFIYVLVDNYNKNVDHQQHCKENIELRDKIHQLELEMVKISKNNNLYPYVYEPSAPDYQLPTIKDKES